MLTLAGRGVQLAEISRTFAAVAEGHGGSLNRQQIEAMLQAAGVGTNGEVAGVLWGELGLDPDSKVTLVSH